MRLDGSNLSGRCSVSLISITVDADPTKTEHFRQWATNCKTDPATAYRIGPRFTEGWLARVQSLAKVVAEEGTLDLTLFASRPSTRSSNEERKCRT